jgi:hypothetical protein
VLCFYLQKHTCYRKAVDGKVLHPEQMSQNNCMTPLGNKKLEPGKMSFDIQSGCRAFFSQTFSDEGDGQKRF